VSRRQCIEDENIHFGCKLDYPPPPLALAIEQRSTIVPTSSSAFVGAQGAQVTTGVTDVLAYAGAIAGEAIAVDTTASRFDIVCTSATVSCAGAIDGERARPKSTGTHAAGTVLSQDETSEHLRGDMCTATATTGAAKIHAPVSTINCAG
jgi:hypothetical protein